MACCLILSDVRYFTPVVSMLPAEEQTIPAFSIGSVARLLGISVHTIRMYEREGLIIPFRTRSGQRRYSAEDIEHFRCIRRAINEDKLGIAGIQRLQAIIPCWQIVGCPAEKRHTCPAYTGHTKACWTYDRSGTACADRGCRQCAVYAIATDCNKIKQFIVALTETSDITSSVHSVIR
jgi:MerR family transcriptional regulator/heat shock protein HspR